MKSEQEIASSIKSTVKTLRVLRLYSMEKTVWSVQEMARELGYHKSSIQRIVTTLEAEGFLSRVSEGKALYRLGPVILFLGNLAEVSTDLRSIAQPVMNKLVEAVQETAYLCVLDGYQSLYVEKVECSQSVRIVHGIGKRNPLYCTGVGKILLSGMEDEEIERMIAERGLVGYTPTTITDRERLLEEIRKVRSTGIAEDLEELDRGVRCVAAPIINREGKIVASLSISGPVQRFTPERMRHFETELRSAAGEISFKLGYWPKESLPAESAGGDGEGPAARTSKGR